MRGMMIHWGRDLQKKRATSRQFDHLGWVDDTKTEFILPTALYRTDGTEQPCTLSAMARQTLDFVGTSGSLAESVRLMNFYNKPEYIKHQFVVMCGLGSVLFHATELEGVIVNSSGESGGSKSTALYTAASFWGRPKDYVMNGAPGGMSVLRRISQVHTLCHLPACIDEITKMEPKEAHAFAFGATQGKPPERLKNDGTPRPVRGGRKATMLLTTANSSLHDLLSADNRAGVAGNMRVLEIFFRALDTSPAEADIYLHGLSKNFGWIGPEFLRRYLADRERIDEMVRALKAELDARYALTSPERYWSAAMAAALVAGRLAREWGLLPFDVEPVRHWLYEELLVELRGIISSEATSSDPVSLLSSFLDDNVGHTIRVSADGNDNGFAQHVPTDAITIHRDVAKQLSYVRKEAFRAWCDRRSKSALRTMQDLVTSGVIARMNVKYALGQGTIYASGRSTCFVVDHTHPAFAAAGTPKKVVPLRAPQAAKEEVN